MIENGRGGGAGRWGAAAAAIKRLYLRDGYVAAYIFVVAAAARLAMMLYLRNFDTVPGYESEDAAMNMVNGLGYSITYLGPRRVTSLLYPLYTFFLYFHFLLFGKNYLLVELTQTIISSGSCVLLFFLGRKLFDRNTGVLAGVLCALYPTYVYWTLRIQAVTVEVFLFILLLLLLTRAKEKERYRDWAVAGFVCGLAVLSKTLYLLLIPAFVLWIWIYGKAPLRNIIPKAAVFVLIAALTISPWTIRNIIVLKKFVLVANNAGVHLWMGNNPHATGGTFASNYQPMTNLMDDDLRERIRNSTDDLEKDEIFKQEALEFIRTNAKASIALIPKRLYALWWFDPYMPSDFGPMRSVIYLMLLVPAIAGMIVSRKRIRETSIFYMIYFTLTASYSMFIGGARFRYVIEFSFILFAAHFIVVLWDKLYKHYYGGAR